MIIGAGPAGTTCACLLKRAGVDCVLVDFASFPREKICGGGLTPRAWHLLEELLPDLKYDYLPVRKCRLIVDGKARVEIEPTEEQRNVSRKDFDNALLQYYLNLGGEFVQDAFSAFQDTTGDDKMLVSLKSGEQICCRYLVGADGANSRVRRQLLGKYRGNVLFLEQKVKKRDNVLDGEISSRYNHGYYYRFPHMDYDVVGYGEKHASAQKFRDLLKGLGIPETKIQGAYIPVEVVESGRDNIMLIGDAGGFANSLTYEGLYYALVTGRNASIAIRQGIPFREANRDIFRRKRREKWMANFFYTPLGRWITKACCHNKDLVRKLFDKGVAAKQNG